ncbi:hypothetical protein FSP39_018957 [Pinctada imbricata]|uniref:Death domain-containing protein n=1 Tax=Pinctada imbricata TaxID=66713 RepID=A0AA88YEG1_PINIB|nr:hypothetical protein FSP39_018957 [Pinctada imbricata]
MFLIKEAYPKLLDAISDRISTTYLHVGIELGFHFEEIKQFRMNNRRNTQKIIREMLITWLDRNKSSGKATVAWLATALLNTQSNIEKLIEYEDTTMSCLRG